MYSKIEYISSLFSRPDFWGFIYTKGIPTYIVFCEKGPRLKHQKWIDYVLCFTYYNLSSGDCSVIHRNVFVDSWKSIKAECLRAEQERHKEEQKQLTKITRQLIESKGLHTAFKLKKITQSDYSNLCNKWTCLSSDLGCNYCYLEYPVVYTKNIPQKSCLVVWAKLDVPLCKNVHMHYKCRSKFPREALKLNYKT